MSPLTWPQLSFRYYYYQKLLWNESAYTEKQLKEKLYWWLSLIRRHWILLQICIIELCCWYQTIFHSHWNNNYLGVGNLQLSGQNCCSVKSAKLDAANVAGWMSEYHWNVGGDWLYRLCHSLWIRRITAHVRWKSDSTKTRQGIFQ